MDWNGCLLQYQPACRNGSMLLAPPARKRAFIIVCSARCDKKNCCCKRISVDSKLAFVSSIWYFSPGNTIYTPILDGIFFSIATFTITTLHAIMSGPPSKYKTRPKFLSQMSYNMSALSESHKNGGSWVVKDVFKETWLSTIHVHMLADSRRGRLRFIVNSILLRPQEKLAVLVIMSTDGQASLTRPYIC